MQTDFSVLMLDKFTGKFNDVYKELGQGKTKILKYSTIIFKRWFYSALVNETTLSPSFIYSAYTGDGLTVTVPTVTPRISGSHFKSFGLKENLYNIKSHPVVKDLTNLINYCTPDIELDENDCINQPDSEKLRRFLSIEDPYYVNYLTNIAFSLKLLKKSVAIYSNKATVSDNYMLFLSYNQEESLKKIVDATIKLCSKSILEALPKKVPIVSEKGILSLIKKPVPIDDIFKEIFFSFGIDIEHIWDNFDEEGSTISENENAILSSTFFLGVLLDKWFITPFGEYLKIIEPLYCFYYNFEEELHYLLDTINSDGNVEAVLFSPCAFYSFTNLGRLLFASEIDDRKVMAKTNISISELSDLLNIDDLQDKKSNIDINFKESKTIFSFKVKSADEKVYWKIIDAADYNTLHELHLEITVNFDVNFLDYYFYIGQEQSPFCKYVAPGSKGTLHKADNVTIVELSLVERSNMVYVSGNGKKLEIELIQCRPAGKKEHYPRTVKRSKAAVRKDNLPHS